MSYGNTGYWLDGRIAEIVTGVSFEQAMRTRVFNPLHLGPTIPAELRDLMQAPVTRLRSSDDELWGLGWDIRTSRSGARVIGHGGSFGGYQTQLTLGPDQGLAFVVLTNSSQGSKAIKQIERTVLEYEVGVAFSEPEPVATPEIELSLLAGLWIQPLGRYHIEASDGVLMIAIETPEFHKISSSRSGPIRFDNIGGSDFVCFEGPHKGTRADFVRNPESGRIDFLRVGLRVACRT